MNTKKDTPVALRLNLNEVRVLLKHFKEFNARICRGQKHRFSFLRDWSNSNTDTEVSRFRNSNLMTQKANPMSNLVIKLPLS